jgi:hypothetical protein
MSESESPGGAQGEPAGGTVFLLRSIVVKAATGLDGADGSVSVSFVLLRLVNSRTICYVRICRSEAR